MSQLPGSLPVSREGRTHWSVGDLFFFLPSSHEFRGLAFRKPQRLQITLKDLKRYTLTA